LACGCASAAVPSARGGATGTATAQTPETTTKKTECRARACPALLACARRLLACAPLVHARRLLACAPLVLAAPPPHALLAFAPLALVLADARPPALLACAPDALVRADARPSSSKDTCDQLRTIAARSQSPVRADKRQCILLQVVEVCFWRLCGRAGSKVDGCDCLRSINPHQSQSFAHLAKRLVLEVVESRSRHVLAAHAPFGLCCRRASLPSKRERQGRCSAFDSERTHCANTLLYENPCSKQLNSFPLAHAELKLLPKRGLCCSSSWRARARTQWIPLLGHCRSARKGPTTWPCKHSRGWNCLRRRPGWAWTKR
jgi:hypothetical protein